MEEKILMDLLYQSMQDSAREARLSLGRPSNNFMSESRRDIKANLRGALIEAKESIEGKRKLNTLDNLITELRVYVNTTQE